MAWRFVVQKDDGTRAAADAADVAALRALRERALANPTVARFRWWHLPDVHGEPVDQCGGCGWAYAHRDGHRDPQPCPCRCGLVHLVHDCARCGAHTPDPPWGTGCGPVPAPPQR